jgi:hypothetical protein
MLPAHGKRRQKESIDLQGQHKKDWANLSEHRECASSAALGLLHPGTDTVHHL